MLGYRSRYRLSSSFNKHHFYIIRRADVDTECYAVGVESGPWRLSYYNRPECQVLFYRGVPSCNPHLLERIEHHLFHHYKSSLIEGGSKFYFVIPYAELLALVQAEFEKLKYICKCKEFCERE